MKSLRLMGSYILKALDAAQLLTAGPAQLKSFMQEVALLKGEFRPFTNTVFTRYSAFFIYN